MSGEDDKRAGLDVQEAARLRESGEAVVLDVREQEEWDAGHIPHATFIPMDEVDRRLAELPSDGHVITVCRSGSRSGQVAQDLQANGYRADNIEGGMQAWQEAGLPMEPPDGRVA